MNKAVVNEAFSESQIKTIKYHPNFPKHFADEADVNKWAEATFAWYNDEHEHSALT